MYVVYFLCRQSFPLTYCILISREDPIKRQTIFPIFTMNDKNLMSIVKVADIKICFIVLLLYRREERKREREGGMIFLLLFFFIWKIDKFYEKYQVYIVQFLRSVKSSNSIFPFLYEIRNKTRLGNNIAGNPCRSSSEAIRQD